MLVEPHIISENDVLFGRGHTANQLRKRSLYRSLLEQHRSEYKSRDLFKKKTEFVMNKIIRPIQEKGGRFLLFQSFVEEQNGDPDHTKAYCEDKSDDMEFVANKIKQALRDLGKEQHGTSNWKFFLGEMIHRSNSIVLHTAVNSIKKARSRRTNNTPAPVSKAVSPLPRPISNISELLSFAATPRPDSVATVPSLADCTTKSEQSKLVRDAIREYNEIDPEDDDDMSWHKETNESKDMKSTEALEGTSCAGTENVQGSCENKQGDMVVLPIAQKATGVSTYMDYIQNMLSTIDGRFHEACNKIEELLSTNQGLQTSNEKMEEQNSALAKENDNLRQQLEELRRSAKH